MRKTTLILMTMTAYHGTSKEAWDVINESNSFNAVKNHLFIQLTVNERLNRIGYSQPNCTVLAVRDASVISVGIPIKEGVVT